MSDKEIMEYLHTAKELMEVDYELSMASKLLEKTQTELDYNRLRQLQPYLSVIVKKLGELQGRKVDLQNKLTKIEPPFIRFINSVQEHISKLHELLSMVYHGKINLKDFWDNISTIKERIPKMLEGLNKSREIILRLQTTTPDEVKRFLNSKLNTIDKLSKYLDRLSQVVSIDPSKILRYKKTVGKIVIVEPQNEQCVISEVYIDTKGEIYLELSIEQEISGDALESLYKEIGLDFTATDVRDFQEKLLRRMHSRMGFHSLKPSAIKGFLREEGLLHSLSRETAEKLTPNFQTYGYAPISKLTSSPSGYRISDSDVVRDAKGLIKCPSVNMLPPRIIGKILHLENKYFLVVSQTFLPRVGRVLVCLQQDSNGEPHPDASLIDKIFRLLARKKTIDPEVKRYISKAIKLLERGKNVDEAYWILRILIVRAGLKTSKRITESSALRPAYVFSYCLQNGIPLLFQEIVSHYVYVIETDLVEFEGKEPKIKMPIKPKPFFEVFDIKLLNILVGQVCHENLGIIGEENKIILICAPPINQEIIRRKSEEYGLTLDFAQTASKLIRTLIYFEKVRSLTEYRTLLDELNVQYIIYNELVKGFEENDELIAAHTFFLELMKTEAA